MANVNIKFNNKDYLLSCDEGQEENLKQLASHLDEKYNDLKKNLGNLGENKLLLITAIQIVDNYFDIIENKFSLVGLNDALDRAKRECMRIVKERKL